VNHALILEYYDDLAAGGDLKKFVRRVKRRYTEGTLQRLLLHDDVKTRAAALVALRFVGSMASNAAVAARLRDDRPHLRELAEGTIWTLWFRAESAGGMEELQRLARLIADEKYAPALAGLTRLLRKYPRFAEAYNQRAILHWKRRHYRRAIADCKRVLKLNPYHFGALAGMAQCYIQLERAVESLAAFREAYRINPNLDGVSDSIHALEQLLRGN
jgi:tetratricopeptide (TPR) repeat protein